MGFWNFVGRNLLRLIIAGLTCLFAWAFYVWMAEPLVRFMTWEGIPSPVAFLLFVIPTLVALACGVIAVMMYWKKDLMKIVLSIFPAMIAIAIVLVYVTGEMALTR